MIDASSSTSGVALADERSSTSGIDGNAGNASDFDSNGATVVGSPYRVRTVTPSPAAAAAHKPARLGLVNATRQGMPA